MPFEIPKLDALRTQPGVRDLLLSVASSNRAPSYLFSGPSGSGKSTHALAWVRTLFCAGGTGPCDCGVCRHVIARVHPDLVWVDSEFVRAHLRENREIKTDVIPADAARALVERMGRTPSTAPLRVAIVPSADRMNIEAQNIMLKTLEEPPSRAMFILLSERPAKLLPTVMSRCRTVRFTPVAEDLLKDALAVSHGFDAVQAGEAASWSGGDFREALHYADPSWREFRDKVAGDFDRALSGATQEWMDVSLAFERPDRDFDNEDEEISEAQSRRRAVQTVLKICLSLWVRRFAGRQPIPAKLRALPPDGVAAVLDRHLEALEGNLSPRMVLDHLFLTLREGLKTGRLETRGFFDLAVQ